MKRSAAGDSCTGSLHSPSRPTWSGGAWFFAAPGDWLSDRVLFTAEETHHALHVLRISPGESINVTDGEGTVARCALGAVEDGSLAAEIIEKVQMLREQPEIVVYQAAAKGSKVDEIVERCAELGVAEVRVFQSARTVVRWQADKVERLAARWAAAARGAAKQSRNPFVMRTGPVCPWMELVDRLANEDLVLTLWEDAARSLREALPPRPLRLALVVGPEGGFSRQEAASLAQARASPVSLGPRIFRTEMAAQVAISSILWHYGLIG
jgi:16S rRNA (uracil1498-N3)-methyltransferase